MTTAELDEDKLLALMSAQPDYLLREPDGDGGGYSECRCPVRKAGDPEHLASYWFSSGDLECVCWHDPSEILTAMEAKRPGHDHWLLEYEWFWERRPLLRAIRDNAREELASPWAVFGVVLALAAAQTPPSVALPPRKGRDENTPRDGRGGVGSLNLMVAVCGESGEGKSVAVDTARAMLVPYLDPPGELMTVKIGGAGSGEGLLEAYGEHRQMKVGKSSQFVRTYASMLYIVDEVKVMKQQIERGGSTLTGFMSTAWMGGMLSIMNAQKTTSRTVDAHTYRLAAVVGVQPANADLILNEADSGFPQRWLWLPVYDPHLGQSPQAAPRPYRWKVRGSMPFIDADKAQFFRGDLHVMDVPEEARRMIRRAALMLSRPIGSPPPESTLDGHALFSRLKVAGLLALLDERMDVNEEDWMLSGVVLKVSDGTRRDVQRQLRVVSDRSDAGTGLRRGRIEEFAVASRAEVHEQRVQKARRDILDWLTRNPGPQKRSDVLIMGYQDRAYREEAIERMIADGDAVATSAKAGNGRMTSYLRLP